LKGNYTWKVLVSELVRIKLFFLLEMWRGFWQFGQK